MTHGYIRGWQIDVGATARRSHDLQANLNRSSVGAANGMMISALAEGGDGAIPWLLAARADTIAR